MGGDRGSEPPWKITSGYRFPKKYWYRPSLRSNWTPWVQIASLGRVIQPSVFRTPPLTEFSRSTHRLYLLFLNSLDVSFISVAYITEEGKTKVNLFFKSTEYIHVTKIRIKVSVAIMGVGGVVFSLLHCCCLCIMDILV